MKKKSILFVDDEQKILSGLKRYLHKKRAIWDMDFVSCGNEALKKMDNREFDVVVSDIMMPEMDGVRLLEEIRRLHPKTVRLVISGYAETETENKAVLVAHQYLSKPLNSKELENTITRACNVQDRMNNNELKKIVSQIGTLPSLPQVYLEMTEALTREASVNDIADIVMKDMAMTTKVLQIVNSAFFGFLRQISDIREAVIYLGLDTMKALTLSIHAFREFKPTRIVKGFSPDDLMDHCLNVGNISKKLAERHDLKKSEQNMAHTSGILHDLGILILFSRKPDVLERSLVATEEKHVLLSDVESEMIGVTHADLGAYLLDLWNLPYNIVEAVIQHHNPLVCSHDSPSIPRIVYTANVYVNIKKDSNDLEKIEDLKELYHVDDHFFEEIAFLEGG